MSHNTLDRLDKKILGMVANDARVSYLEVARECNVSGAAIHQRIQKLKEKGVILGSKFVLDPEKIGYETCAYMELFLQDPSKYSEVVSALEEIPEVVECYYTTGSFDLFIKMYARNNHHLLDIIHNKIQPLGLARTESIISFKTIFCRPLPIDGGGK